MNLFKKLFMKRGNNMQIISNSNNCVQMSGNHVTIDGKTIEIPSGAEVSIINGTVYVDGNPLDVTGTSLHNNERAVINIIVAGNADTVHCNGSVSVKGNVRQDISCNGSVSVGGRVSGSIKAGGSVSIKGGYNGSSIRAGGSVITK